MDKYEEILASGSLIVKKTRPTRRSTTDIVVTTQKRYGGCRISIRIPPKIAQSADLAKGDYCNLVILPCGKYCLCKVRQHLGFILSGVTKSHTLYCYIPHIATTVDKVIGSVEGFLIVFPEGSFNEVPIEEN